MGWVLFEKKIRSQPLPSKVGLEDRFKNRFNRCLFSGEIDSQELIKKAFHLSYLKRNLIVKSRHTDYPLPPGACRQAGERNGVREEGERNDNTTIQTVRNGVGNVERKQEEDKRVRKNVNLARETLEKRNTSFHLTPIYTVGLLVHFAIWSCSFLIRPNPPHFEQTFAPPGPLGNLP